MVMPGVRASVRFKVVSGRRLSRGGARSEVDVSRAPSILRALYPRRYCDAHQNSSPRLDFLLHVANRNPLFR